MKAVIKVIAISLLIVNVSKGQDELLLVKGSFDNLSIKKVPLEKLYMVDNDFAALEALGEPIKIDTALITAEPKWIFYYPGFSLTFVQFFPTGPELLEVEVTGQEAKFSTFDKNLFENNQQSLKRDLGQLEFKEVSTKLTDSEKFGDDHRYLEYHYFGSSLKKLIYKIDPNL